ncbi:macrophage colony-stimulating factor 1 [Pogona vitticeps]
MTSHIPLALLLLVACTINEAEKTKEGCHRLITESHLRNLSDLIDSQMKTSCKYSFCYVDKTELGNVECFLKAAFSPLSNILDQIKFKNNSPNFKKLKAIQDLHLELLFCLGDDHVDKHCTKRFFLTAEDMLQLVYDYFSDAQRFLSKPNISQDCSSIFQKCSDCEEKKETEVPGVVTDQDCPCLATSPNSGGGLASLHPASESSSSVADHLDSKEAADGIQQLFVLPGTTLIQGVAEHSTRPRVLRSTQMGSEATGSMDFRADTEMVTSLPAEEQPLTSVLKESEPQTTNSLSLLDPAITLDQFSHQLKNIPPSISSQHHIDSLEIKSPVPGSGDHSGQAWPDEVSSLPSGLDKSFLSKQWLQTGEMKDAITGLVTVWDTAGTSSTPSLTLASSAGLKPVDGTRVPSSSGWATLPPDVPVALYHVLDSEESVSATLQPSRLVANTDSPSSPRQISPESGSWGEVGNRGRAPGGQQSTQLRERRAERDEGLAQDREPEDSMPGPGSDLSFIPPNTDKHTKKPEPSDTRGMTVIYVVVSSVLGILLAMGGLLFYLHKIRFVAQRRSQRNESNMERPEEGRPLNKEEEHVELQIQEKL